MADRTKEDFERAEAEFAFDWDPDEPAAGRKKANGKHPPPPPGGSALPQDPFRTISAGDVTGPIRTVPWLIKHVLGDSGLASLYGRPGCGKSFVAISLGLHIAHGIPWRRYRTRQAGVYYFSMEAGGHGVNRVVAAIQHHKIPWPPLFRMSAGLFSLLEREQAEQFVETARTHGWPIGLIIVDTLARALGGGNENNSEDMGAVIGNADWLANELGAALLFVAHSGKDASRGMRGHSSMVAAVNTEIELERAAGQPGVFRVTKQRDGADAVQLGFNLEQVPLGRDEDGDEMSSCVVVPAEIPQQAQAAAPKMPKGIKLVLRALDRALADARKAPARDQPPEGVPPHAVTELEWRRAHSTLLQKDTPANTRRMAFNRGADWLVAEGMATRFDGYAWRPER